MTCMLFPRQRFEPVLDPGHKMNAAHRGKRRMRDWSGSTLLLGGLADERALAPPLRIEQSAGTTTLAAVSSSARLILTDRPRCIRVPRCRFELRLRWSGARRSKIDSAEAVARVKASYVGALRPLTRAISFRTSAAFIGA